MKNVKRYSNRKLYDSDSKHYVTLVDIARAVRAGDDVQVHDYVTGVDITSRVLAQVIALEESKAPRVGVEVLTRVIREGIPA
jgi:polyhydroxyalkanoate synthesis repressor PhaR